MQTLAMLVEKFPTECKAASDAVNSYVVCVARGLGKSSRQRYADKARIAFENILNLMDNDVAFSNLKIEIARARIELSCSQYVQNIICRKAGLTR